MNLIKNNWTESDIIEFHQYLLTLSKGEKASLIEKNVAKTKLKCIAVSSDNIDKIVKEIYKGNYFSFISYFTWNNLSEVCILGKLICRIKNFNFFKKYLYQYAVKVDSWAMTDTLSFKINIDNSYSYFTLAKKFIKDKKPFARRIGLLILFKMISFPFYLNETFAIIDTFYDEDNYYVNMMLAWLLAELFIKRREATISYLNNHHLNKFVINKMISKCRDSYRVSKEDKTFLLSFKSTKPAL